MKLDVNSLSTVLALGLAGWGGYMLYTNPNAAQPDQIKYIVATVVSVGYLLYTYSDKLKGLIQSRPTSARVFSPEDFEEQDFKCLVHLRNRVTEARCKEGVETCEKLNSIIFALHAQERMQDEKTAG